MTTRRDFLKRSAAAGSLLAAGGLAGCTSGTGSAQPPASAVPDDALNAILQHPVLRRELFPDPVTIESIELLQNGKYYIVRARSTDGAEGFAVGNEAHLRNLWPVFLRKVAPSFQGKDARDLDRLVEDCFRSDSSYKYQSLAIWLPIASAEFAVLDLLGQISGRPVGAMVGEVIRSSIDVYRANNYRGRSAEESVERIIERHQAEKSRAVKFKVGGRMNLPEAPPGRSDRLIPMLREALGDDVTIYADANGSYDVAEAVRDVPGRHGIEHAAVAEPEDPVARRDGIVL